MAPAVQADRTVGLALVSEHGPLLQHLPEELRDDREIVMAAVCNHYWGDGLQHASAALRGDRGVVEAAIDAADGYAFMVAQHMSAELQDDREVVLRAVRLNGYALQHASVGLRADREVVAAALQGLSPASFVGTAIGSEAAELRADLDFMKSLLQLHPDDVASRQEIADAGSEGIRAELAAIADPDVAKVVAELKR